jgi:hypothetical protein
MSTSFSSIEIYWVALKRAVCWSVDAGSTFSRRLLGRRVLGHSLGAFADGVLGQFSGQEQADGRLDFAAGDRRTAVVVRQTRCLGGDALEDVVDEAVHDAHRLRADAGVRVHLLQHLVDVDGVRLSSSALLLLVSSTSGFRLARCLLGSLRCWFRRHVYVLENETTNEVPTALSSYIYDDVPADSAQQTTLCAQLHGRCVRRA